MPVHNHALDPFLIRPSWLSMARRVEGARVSRSVDRPENPLSLPFTHLPATIDPDDQPVLQLFLRAAESARLGNAHRCSGCAGIFRENSKYLGKAADLAQAALPSARNSQNTSTSLILLSAIADPMAQARRFFRSIEPMPAENYTENEEWWNVYLDQHMTIAIHVDWVLAALRCLSTEGTLENGRWPNFWTERWKIGNYIDPWARRLTPPESVAQADERRDDADMFDA